MKRVVTLIEFDIMEQPYELLPELFLRAPFYSNEDYHPKKLNEILQQPFFQNALWLASPSFYRILEKKKFDFATLSEKEISSLLKYYNRMSFRATPFGSFASFTVLRWTSDSRVNLKASAAGILHLLPSQEFLGELSDRYEIPVDTDLIVLNPTLYRFGSTFRFIRYSVPAQGKYTYMLSSIAAEWLTRILVRRLQRQALSWAYLTQLVIEKTGSSPGDAESFLVFLLEQQFLYGPARGDIMAGDLALNSFSSKWLAEVSVPMELYHWPSVEKFPAASAVLLSDLAEKIKDQRTSVPFESPLYYGALERPLQSGGLSVRYQEDLRQGLKALQYLSVSSEVPALRKFIDAFREKFDQQRVPLMLALDPNRGISYMNTEETVDREGLLKGLKFQNLSASRQQISWNAVHQLFLRLWMQNDRRYFRSPIVIRESDWEGWESQFNAVQVAPTLAVLFSKAGGKLSIEMVSSISATALVGRFNLFSQETEDLCHQLAGIEANLNPDVIFADICQLTDRHVDNINRRKPVYDYHIPVNVYSSVPGEQVIPLNDLLISVHHNELILESGKLGKRIIPRLSTAFNFMHNDLSVFRLLCDLQFQGLDNNLSFDLERFFPGLDFYPRVEYGEVVLSLARWHIRQSAIQSLTLYPLSLGRLHLFLQQHQIPFLIILGSGDQQLTFDLSCDSQALHFLSCIRNTSSQLIREYLAPDNTIMSEKRPLNGQFVAFFAAQTATYQGLPNLRHFEGKKARQFPPGSEWIYLKIYGHADAGNRLLSEALSPILEKYAEMIETWFFIRYADPRHHLRLRIRTSGKDAGALLKVIMETLVLPAWNGLIQKWQQEVYERELERYSPEKIDEVEAVFCLGSVYALEQIHLHGTINKPAGVFRLMYEMIASFFPEVTAQEHFSGNRAAGLLSEYSDQKNLKVRMDQRYREIRPELRAELGSTSPDWEAGTSAVLKKLMAALRELNQSVAEWSPPKRTALIGDLIHMQVNRMFTDQQREHETFLYHCLHKELQSQRAIKKG